MRNDDYESNVVSTDDQPLDTKNVDDESEGDTTVAPVKYNITSFGVDFDLAGLYRRLSTGEIFIPAFQRNFVWGIRESSRFIESLLLDLPVPGIFLARDSDSGKLLVIDGQQRLKSLQFFYDGAFPRNSSNPVEFRLTGVQSQFANASYKDLFEKDRIDLDNSLIHATVVRQDYPADDDTSIYHLFERLNSSGRLLQPQEIRTALYQGSLIDTIQSLNEHQTWREIYGRHDVRMKDQELILRFLAFTFSDQKYTSPMKEFLNVFCKTQRNSPKETLDKYSNSFVQVIDLWQEALGSSAFRPYQSLNAAVFDSMMVGLAQKIAVSGRLSPDRIAELYTALLADDEYMRTTRYSTSHENSVTLRMKKVTDLLAQA